MTEDSSATPPALPTAGTVSSDAPKKSRRRRFLRVAVILAGIAASLLIALHATLLVCISRKTPDFVKVGANKIYLLERTLHSAALDQEIVLMGMAHIGDQSFYDAIEERLSDDGLILWEGVTDEDKLLGGGTGQPYGEISEALGLTQQKRFNQPPEKMVWADVDAAALAPESLQVLNLLFGIMASIDDRTEVRRHLLEFGELEAEKPGVEQRLMADLIDTRNERLLAVIAEHSDAERLFVPWGAWHMPGVEQALQERGFEVVGETQRPLTAMTRVYRSACKALLGAFRTAPTANE